MAAAATHTQRWQAAATEIILGRIRAEPLPADAHAWSIVEPATLPVEVTVLAGRTLVAQLKLRALVAERRRQGSNRIRPWFVREGRIMGARQLVQEAYAEDVTLTANLSFQSVSGLVYTKLLFVPMQKPGMAEARWCPLSDALAVLNRHMQRVLRPAPVPPAILDSDDDADFDSVDDDDVEVAPAPAPAPVARPPAPAMEPIILSSDDDDDVEVAPAPAAVALPPALAALAPALAALAPVAPALAPALAAMAPALAALAPAAPVEGAPPEERVCCICHTEVDAGSRFMRLDPCNSFIHEECAENMVRSAVTKLQPPKCPCTHGRTGQDHEVMATPQLREGLPADLVVRWDEVRVRCQPTDLQRTCPQCRASKTIDPAQRVWFCSNTSCRPVSPYGFCARCSERVDDPATHRCATPLEDAAFVEYMRKHGVHPCPGCNHASTKQSAAMCNHMTCLCGTRYCAVCGHVFPTDERGTANYQHACLHNNIYRIDAEGHELIASAVRRRMG